MSEHSRAREWFGKGRGRQKGVKRGEKRTLILQVGFDWGGITHKENGSTCDGTELLTLAHRLV